MTITHDLKPEQMNTANHIAELTGLQPRHVWADVRRRGIEPRKVHGTFVLTDAQLKKYLELRESGYYVRAAPAAPKQKKESRKPTPRKNKTEPAPATAVPCRAPNGQTYLYIPAPFEVPERWEWKA